MLKTFSIALILFFVCQSVLSQNKAEISPPPIDGVSSNSIEQPGYSESNSYQPRALPEKKFKAEKDKKNKSNATSRQSLPDKEFAPSQGDAGETILVPVSVFDKNGKPVENLKQTDFELFIDGKKHEIASFEAAAESLNIFLFPDTSASAVFEIRGVRHFATQFVESLRPSDNLQIIQFNEKVSVLSPLTNDRRILDKAVRKLESGSGTSIYDSLFSLMRKQIKSVNGRKIVVLLTDGVDTTSSKATYEDSLAETEKNDAAIYPFYVDTFAFWAKNAIRPLPGVLSGTMIGRVSNPAANKAYAASIKEEYKLGRNFLNDAARLSGGRTFEVKSPGRVDKGELEDIRHLFAPIYYIALKPAMSDAPENRWQIKVRINQPNLVVVARGSYIFGTNK